MHKSQRYLVSIDGTEMGHKAFTTALDQATPEDHIYLLSVAISNYVTKADDKVKNTCKLQLSKYGNILTERKVHTHPLPLKYRREFILSFFYLRYPSNRNEHERITPVVQNEHTAY